jgi:hypothetical protein
VEFVKLTVLTVKLEKLALLPINTVLVMLLAETLENVGYNIVAFDNDALEPVNKELIVAFVVVNPVVVAFVNVGYNIVALDKLAFEPVIKELTVRLLVVAFVNVGYNIVALDNDALLPVISV